MCAKRVFRTTAWMQEVEQRRSSCRVGFPFSGRLLINCLTLPPARVLKSPPHTGQSIDSQQKKYGRFYTQSIKSNSSVFSAA